MPVIPERYGRSSTDGDDDDVVDADDGDTKADVFVKTGLFPEEFIEIQGGNPRL